MARREECARAIAALLGATSAPNPTQDQTYRETEALAAARRDDSPNALFDSDSRESGEVRFGTRPLRSASPRPLELYTEQP